MLWTILVIVPISALVWLWLRVFQPERKRDFEEIVFVASASVNGGCAMVLAGGMVIGMYPAMLFWIGRWLDFW
jgi:hypothetical protein